MHRTDSPLAKCKQFTNSEAFSKKTTPTSHTGFGSLTHTDAVHFDTLLKYRNRQAKEKTERERKVEAQLVKTKKRGSTSQTTREGNLVSDEITSAAPKYAGRNTHFHAQNKTI